MNAHTRGNIKGGQKEERNQQAESLAFRVLLVKTSSCIYQLNSGEKGSTITYENGAQGRPFGLASRHIVLNSSTSPIQCLSQGI